MFIENSEAIHTIKSITTYGMKTYIKRVNTNMTAILCYVNSVEYSYVTALGVYLHSIQN